MVNFLKQNWFKVGLIFSILVLSLASYALIGSGKNNLDKLKLATQCREDGEKYFQKDKDTATKERYEAGHVDCFYMEPAFIFNKELETCLYSGGYSCDLYDKYTDGPFAGKNASAWTRHIYDIYTNKSLANVSITNSAKVEDWENSRVGDFWKKSKELGF